MQHADESMGVKVKVVEADKIGSVVSVLGLQRQLAVVGERRRARVGDAVVVRALTDSATYNQLELPSGRLAKINPGDVVVGALGRRRALKGFVGMKSRGVYETPGVTILQAAHRALESITLDREVLRLRDTLSLKFAESVYYGFWFAPESELMRRTIDATQEAVTGEARVKLYRGNVIVTGRRSPNSLYQERLATFEADTVYNQRDAEGFIKLNALRLRTKAATSDK